MELKTPLYDAHVKAGGKIVPFGGYLLPVQYETGVIKEHMAVRTQAGLFDVSHMGEGLWEGKDALANLQMLLTNNFDNMVDGQARYSPMCNENGGTVDDLIVYKKSEEHYFIVVNAANKDKDFQWMLDHQFGDVTFTDVSDRWAQLALQGPKAMEILRKLTEEACIPKKYYHAVFGAEVAGIPCIVSKTGYTGEDGVELYLDSSNAEKMWDILLENGKEEGLIPCGLGARDTLRMEAAMPLYGHEMDDEVSPLETGLGFAVKMAKENNVVVGAHPSYPDLVGFGRRKMVLSPLEIKNDMKYQIGALMAFTQSEGMKLHHVAPHGALGNQCQYDKEVARAICEAVYEVDPELIIYYCAGAVLGDIAESKGLRTASEIFADRAYMDDLSLVNC